jgi:peptide/nickel transport system substrate-binding protein
MLGHRVAKLMKSPDYDKAKQLLAEAGHGSGFKTKIVVRNSTEFTSAAQIIAASLAKAGITAEVETQDPSAMLAMADDKNGAWKQMTMYIQRFNNEADPSWATAWFVSSQIGLWNWERFSNAEFDRLDVEGKSEADPAKRGAMYVRMQDLMEESGSYVFLAHPVNASIYRDTIKPALTPDGLRQIFRDYTTA